MWWKELIVNAVTILIIFGGMTYAFKQPKNLKKQKMKKLLLLLISLVLLTGCKDTSPSQDTQMLQSKYDIVYPIGDDCRFICCDTSNHVYMIRINADGRIFSIVKIK